MKRESLIFRDVARMPHFMLLFRSELSHVLTNHHAKTYSHPNNTRHAS